MKRISVVISALLMLANVFLPIAEAGGLSTLFGEVTLENLEAGKTYSTQEASNLPLEILNTGKEDMDLHLEVLPAQEQELKAGFEPIPDLSWIKLEKADFKSIKPGEKAVTNVFISVPDNKQYAGKKYQVFIWSHTVGGTVGIGLKSKLLLIIKGGQNE